MRELHKALFRFWSGFTWGGQPLPAFPSGRVPDNQPFPYVTFEVMQGDYFNKLVMTAFVWCQKPAGVDMNVQDQRATLLDQVAAAIPIEGTWLTFPGGAVRLTRNDTNWLSYYDPTPDPTSDTPTAPENPTGEPVIGGRVSYIAQFFVR